MYTSAGAIVCFYGLFVGKQLKRISHACQRPPGCICVMENNFRTAAYTVRACSRVCVCVWHVLSLLSALALGLSKLIMKSSHGRDAHSAPIYRRRPEGPSRRTNVPDVPHQMGRGGDSHA